jgi:hypothetical protein
MAFLEKTFKGAAEAAADTDPYARLQIIMGELQEQIGTALLPILNEFSDWLATPEGQEKLQEIVDGVVVMITKFTELMDFIDTQIVPGLEELTGEKGFGAVITTVSNLVIGLGILKIALAVFSSGNPALAGILAGLALLAGAMYTVYQRTKQANDQLAEFQRLQNIERVTRNPSTPEQIAAETYQGILDVGKKPVAQKLPVEVPKKPGSLKVDIQANINAQSVIKQINSQLKSQGSSLRIQ